MLGLLYHYKGHKLIVFLILLLVSISALPIHAYADTVTAQWNYQQQGLSISIYYVLNIDVELSVSSSNSASLSLSQPAGYVQVSVSYQNYQFTSPQVPLNPGQTQTINIDTGIPFVTLTVDVTVQAYADLSATNAQLSQTEINIPGSVQVQVSGSPATVTATIYATPTVGVYLNSPLGNINLPNIQLPSTQMSPSITRTISVTSTTESVNNLNTAQTIIPYVAPQSTVGSGNVHYPTYASPQYFINTILPVIIIAVATILAVAILSTALKAPQAKSTSVSAIRALYRLRLPGGVDIPVFEPVRVFGRETFEKYVPSEVLQMITREERGGHFRIFLRGNKWYIEDLNSTNGTLLNGKEIKGKGPQELKNGDTINPAGVLEIKFIT